MNRGMAKLKKYSLWVKHLPGLLESDLTMRLPNPEGCYLFIYLFAEDERRLCEQEKLLALYFNSW